MHKFDVKRFALAGGIYLGGCVSLCTLCSLVGIPGFPQFTQILVSIYGSYGYSVSLAGIVTGAILGFMEGFFHLGAFAVIYNALSGKK